MRWVACVRRVMTANALWTVGWYGWNAGVCQCILAFGEGMYVVHKPRSTIGRLILHMKARPPKEEFPRVVYEVPLLTGPRHLHRWDEKLPRKNMPAQAWHTLFEQNFDRTLNSILNERRSEDTSKSKTTASTSTTYGSSDPKFVTLASVPSALAKPVATVRFSTKWRSYVLAWETVKLHSFPVSFRGEAP